MGFRLVRSSVPENELKMPSSVSLVSSLQTLGIKTKVMQDSIPENAQAKAILNSRIYVVIWLLIIFGTKILVILVKSLM